MKTLLFYILLVSFSVTSCKTKTQWSVNDLIEVDSTIPFKKEIAEHQYPVDDTDSSNLVAKMFQIDPNNLKPEALEHGFHDLQIRVWLGHSRALHRHLVILKLSDKKWKASLVDIIGKEVKNPSGGYMLQHTIHTASVFPKSGWDAFVRHLKDIDVFNTLNKQDVTFEENCGNADGMSYYFEFATATKYRLISHCYPTGNLLEFSKYLEQQFDFEYKKD